MHADIKWEGQGSNLSKVIGNCACKKEMDGNAYVRARDLDAKKVKWGVYGNMVRKAKLGFGFDLTFVHMKVL